MAKSWQKIVEEHKAKLAKANEELAKTKAQTEAKGAWWAHFHNDPRPGEEVAADIDRRVAAGEKPPVLPFGERSSPIEETTDILPGGKAVSMPFADFAAQRWGYASGCPIKAPASDGLWRRGRSGSPADSVTRSTGRDFSAAVVSATPAATAGTKRQRGGCGGRALPTRLRETDEQAGGESGGAEEPDTIRPTPSPAPQAGGAEKAGIYRNIGSVAGWAIGSAGGPIGASLGQMIGGWAGELAGGGKVSTKEIAGSLLGVAGGAAAGGVGAKLGTALGGLFGGNDGGGSEGGGAINVGGGGEEGSPQEMVRLLREISANIRSLVGDGIVLRGDHRHTGTSII